MRHVCRDETEGTRTPLIRPEIHESARYHVRYKLNVDGDIEDLKFEIEPMPGVTGRPLEQRRGHARERRNGQNAGLMKWHSFALASEMIV